MQVFYKDKELEKLVETGNSKEYKKYARQPIFLKQLRKVIAIFKLEENTSCLYKYGHLHYEKLLYERYGQSSVRISYKEVERLVFTEKDGGVIIDELELELNHYATKR